MARTKLTNYQILNQAFVLEQLANVNTALARHEADSPEVLYLMGEREILLKQLEELE